MRMRMKPIGTGSIVYHKFINELLAPLDNIHRVTIHFVWNMQSMPMNDAFVGKFIGVTNTNLLIGFQTNYGTKI